MEYYKQIQKGIDYIEKNLQSPLSIKTIAQETGFSPFYFQRLFQAISGLSTQSYIRKRRLSEAAKRLVNSETAMMDIAFQFQYSSQEAFSRAFTENFKITPSAYRKEQQPIRLTEAMDFLSYKKDREDALSMPKPTIQSYEARYICGYEYKTTLADDEHYKNIPGFYEDFKVKEHYLKFPDKTPDQAYGVACCFQEDGSFSFVIGGAVDKESNPPEEGFTIVELPAGLYASFPNTNLVPDMRDYIYGVWLPNSQYVRTEGPDFEVTDLTKSMQKQKIVMTIYIPVAKIE